MWVLVQNSTQHILDSSQYFYSAGWWASFTNNTSLLFKIYFTTAACARVEIHPNGCRIFGKVASGQVRRSNNMNTVYLCSNWFSLCVLDINNVQAYATENVQQTLSSFAQLHAASDSFTKLHTASQHFTQLHMQLCTAATAVTFRQLHQVKYKSPA